jgi:hypothetical protein
MNLLKNTTLNFNLFPTLERSHGNFIFRVILQGFITHMPVHLDTRLQRMHNIQFISNMCSLSDTATNTDSTQGDNRICKGLGKKGK